MSNTDEKNQALKLLLVMFAVNLAVGLDRYQGQEALYCHLHCNIKYYLFNTEEHLEPCETSMITLFSEKC